MPRDFKLPDLGEGIHEAQVVRVLVSEGQQIKEDQPVAEVETDKAAVELPSPYSGTVQQIHIKEGQTINVGAVLITFDGEGGAAAPKAEKGARAEAGKAQRPEAQRPQRAEPEAPEEPEAEEARPAKGAAAPQTDRKAPGQPPARAPAARAAEPAARTPEPAAHRTTAPAAPAVRKLAREMGVDIDSLEGTGPGGRVTQQDVEAAAAGSQRGAPAPSARAPAAPGRPASPAAPQRPSVPSGVAAADQWGATRRVPLTQIRKTIAAQMSRSVYTIPHVTHHDEADVTDLDRLRRGYFRKDDPSTKLSFMPFIIRALCTALRQHPVLNASFDGEANEIVYKDYFNIGVAVDTPRGLIVPVIRDADRMNILDLAGALAVIAEKVRASQFTLDELRGGTFTITNYGAIGGIFGTPIINYPEVAILGIGRAQQRVVPHDGKMEIRTILPLSVSFDHRATDGAEVARFVNDLVALLQNPARLLI